MNDKVSLNKSTVLKRLVEKNKVVDKTSPNKNAVSNKSIFLDESDLLDDSRDMLDISMTDKKTATMSFIPNVDSRLENMSTQSKASSKNTGKTSSRYDKVVSPDLIKKGPLQSKKDN